MITYGCCPRDPSGQPTVGRWLGALEIQTEPVWERRRRASELWRLPAPSHLLLL